MESYAVELEYIGEGWSGDYNPDDPDDEPLLRFTVYRDDEQIEDASYCTRLPESLSMEDRKLVTEAIQRRIEGKENIKRICEELSWLDMTDVERLRRG